MPYSSAVAGWAIAENMVNDAEDVVAVGSGNRDGARVAELVELRDSHLAPPLGAAQPLHKGASQVRDPRGGQMTRGLFQWPRCGRAAGSSAGATVGGGAASMQKSLC